MWLLKCLKEPFSQKPLAVTIITVIKHCQNIHKSILILLLHHSELNMVAKMSLLVTSEILGLVLNIWFTNDKYSRHKRENITQVDQKQISKK